MNGNIGVWIDHREAIVVKLRDSGEETIRIQSGAESQLRRSSDHPTGTFEPLNVVADDSRQRIYDADLNRFYDEVASHLDKARSVLVCGPGEARTEFKKRLDTKHSIAGHLTLEPADSMTEAQLVAKIRKHFHAT